MPTIKGPIKISGGFKASDFIKEKADEIKIKLPFTATGFKSSKTPKFADMAGIKLAKDESKKDDKPNNFRKELLDLNGVGEKSVEIILKMARTKSELKRLSRKKLIAALKDDVVEVLDKYLGGK